MKTENLSTLKIHKLAKEQYEREFEAGNIDPNALYLTPDSTPTIYYNTTEPDNSIGKDGDIYIMYVNEGE